MRKYIVYYYAEKNDECVDCEKEIEAKSIDTVLIEFNSKVKVYKRVFAIIEKSN